MTTEDFIIALFCLIDDRMGAMNKHRQARLWPSELVTIGVLFALKGGYFRAFYRWLVRDHAELFGGVPERTRLLRLLAVHADWCERFLADPTLFTVLDSYGIELLHPIREGRTPHQIGRKGKSNWRWIVGMKLCGRNKSGDTFGRWGDLPKVHRAKWLYFNSLRVYPKISRATTSVFTWPVPS